ncbi:hypothetical protein Zmor_017267 [Zophobas morio]|uniref:Uncharacterized protein n=1 Tax=Zophobas morio TaxID=2755281 RepID=A0AA38MCP1_9CUCU|nr:hypothetical protein Zmor_017267 [Zophobas morio]
MQTHKLLQACGGRSLMLQQLTGAQQKYPWGDVVQVEFGDTGLELFSPHDGDSITKPTRTHISITNVPCGTRPLRSLDPQVDLDYWSKSRALQTGGRP